jgi:UDP-3-O-[3-hydroxymyristoyl] glucosamine N-acyltransferase
MRMGKTLQELADYLGGQVVGDPSAVIMGLGTLDSAVEGQITFLANPKYAAKVASTRASAIVLSPAAEKFGKNCIQVANPHLAFARLLTLYTTRPRISKGVMAGAFVGDGVIMGPEVTVYPGAYIGDNVRMGDRVTIHHNVTVYEGVVLGDDVTLHSGVSVREGCRIGNRVTIHNGTVIGGDGFGYSPDGEGWFKVPQVGIVIIEDDVEIGANSTVDRAAVETTRIGSGTKIDNLVHVAHNCQIGGNGIILAQVGLAGSVTLGKHVTLGGQAAIADHVTIGDNVMVSGQSGVFNNVEEGKVISGTPAILHQSRLKAAAVFPHLPEMRKILSRLGARMAIVEDFLECQRCTDDQR